MNINLMYHQNAFVLCEEQQLIEKAKQNPDYFAPLYKKYFDPIFKYINKRVDEEEMAYDITSNVFVKAMGAIHKFEYRGLPFSSWLFRIAKSEVYQSYRDKKATNEISLNSFNLPQVVEDNTDDCCEANKFKLLKVLKTLKENELQLIELRYFEKRSFKEIGATIGITENNAKVKTFRALMRLKKNFNKLAA
jgi:RNA polymerase sigma-70 factor (ECF subfamily)